MHYPMWNRLSSIKFLRLIEDIQAFAMKVMKDKKQVATTSSGAGAASAGSSSSTTIIYEEVERTLNENDNTEIVITVQQSNNRRTDNAKNEVAIIENQMGHTTTTTTTTTKRPIGASFDIGMQVDLGGLGGGSGNKGNGEDGLKKPKPEKKPPARPNKKTSWPRPTRTFGGGFSRPGVMTRPLGFGLMRPMDEKYKRSVNQLPDSMVRLFNRRLRNRRQLNLIKYVQLANMMQMDAPHTDQGL